MKVCIFYTDFWEFNLATAKAYFAQKRIKWEASTPFTQQQNGLVEQHKWTTIKKARIIIVDFGLFLHLWTETISTIAYVKNKSPFLAIQKGKVTSEETFLQQSFPRVNHLTIFGYIAFIFDEDPMSKLYSKVWKGYLVEYEEKNQYRIYDLVWRQVFVCQDLSHFMKISLVLIAIQFSLNA